MSFCLSTLQLIRSPGIGPVTFHNLVEKCGSVKDALVFLKSQKKDTFPKELAEKEYKEAKKLGIHLLDVKSEYYPSSLKTLADYPPVVSVFGNPEVLVKPMMGIVGARAASVNGIRFTHKLAHGLGDAGYVVVSGLARGIDAAAHKGALEHRTVAVVAGGADVVYPPEHKQLRDDIAKNGAVISEMPLGLFPGAKHFPRRNRLIAAMGIGLCVVEATKPSGSLITASHALDQGREIFAVPGFPGDARSVGTNDLLRMGAHVLESVEDVLHVFGTSSLQNTRANHLSMRGGDELAEKASAYKNITDIQSEILCKLSPTPISVEVLLQTLSYPESTVFDALTRLELDDQIMRDKSGYLYLPVVL